ncbi:MAG TPA: hypothetical protein DIU15_06790 [Deltaproteobacteria bacterium]|nr:hypothetical protein [Deltaproteobacteria bacterium]HCP45729.1 hypothetical protein [Deltaproteobacteria bacterium]
MLARVQRFLITTFEWHVVLNCAFASFVVGMPLILFVPRRFDPDRRLPHRVGTFFWGRLVWALNPFWKLEVEGLERLRKGGPYLICSNHQSLLDVLVIMALGSDFKWVSGLRFFKIPMFAHYMKATGYIGADLKNPFSAGAILEECGAWIDRGVSVGMFPEGTRSRTGEVGLFKSGAFRVAVDRDVPVIPVAIDGSREALPAGSWSWLGASPFKRIRVRLLAPIELSSLDQPSATELSRACRSSIQACLAQWRTEGEGGRTEPIRSEVALPEATRASSGR